MLITLLVQIGPEEQLSAMNDGILAYARVIFVLGGILVLAYLVLRRWLPRVFGMKAKLQGPIQVVDQCALEPRKRLYLVQVGDEFFLLGSWDGGMEMLSKLDRNSLTETSDEGAQMEKPLKTASFRDRLTRS